MRVGHWSMVAHTSYTTIFSRRIRALQVMLWMQPILPPGRRGAARGSGGRAGSRGAPSRRHGDAPPAPGATQLAPRSGAPPPPPPGVLRGSPLLAPPRGVPAARRPPLSPAGRAERALLGGGGRPRRLQRPRGGQGGRQHCEEGRLPRAEAPRPSPERRRPHGARAVGRRGRCMNLCTAAAPRERRTQRRGRAAGGGGRAGHRAPAAPPEAAAPTLPAGRRAGGAGGRWPGRRARGPAAAT